jgi:predicted translin family RNA/ssDNA-binding protein
MSLDKKALTSVVRSYRSMTARRRELQQISSDILGAAKRAIFAIQRGTGKDAEGNLKNARALLVRGKKVVGTDRRLLSEGAWRAALEEFSEAAMYFDAMYAQSVGIPKEIADDPDVVIGALSDMTGECTRSCVLAATRRDYAEVRRLSDLVRQGVAILLELDLTGQLRQKFDQAKQNLRKVEEIEFDLSLARKGD